MSFRFHITRHQALRYAQRHLSIENIKNVVHYPHAIQELNRGEHGGKLRKFSKTIEGKALVVVAEIKAPECWLVTAYYKDE